MHRVHKSRSSVSLLVQVCVLKQRQGRTTSAVTLKKELLLPINPGRVRRPFPNYLKPIILHLMFFTIIFYKWAAFKTVTGLSRDGHPNKFTPRSDCAVLKETAKNQELHVRFCRPQYVKVHDSTKKKQLKKYGLFGVWPGESVFSRKTRNKKKTWHVCKAASEQTTRL